MLDVTTIKKESEEREVLQSTFTLVKQENGIAHLVMNVVGDAMNTLKAEFTEQIVNILADIKADNSIKGIVLMSGKKNSFVAGADVSMIANCKTVADATALSRQGHSIFSQIESLPIPIVAAINDACLGRKCLPVNIISNAF